MLNLTRNWWLVLMRGLLAILFGLGALFWPGLTWVLLIYIFGVYAIMDGVIALLTGIVRSKYSPRWWVFLLEGLVSIAAGVIAIVQPGTTGLILVLVMAAWAIITGVLEIAAAIRLRKEITNEWLLGFGGFVSIAFGILLFFQPAAGSLVITLMVGAYALMFGVVLVMLAFRLRKWDMLGSNRDVLRSAQQ